MNIDQLKYNLTNNVGLQAVIATLIAATGAVKTALVALITSTSNALIAAIEIDDIGRKVVSKTADVTSPALTLLELKSGMILAAKTSAQTLTLPAAGSTLAGVICTFVRTGNASAMTITDSVLTHNSADAIGDSVTVGCTGAAWYVVSSTVA